MSSLRRRLLAGVLLVSALGLVLVGIVVYTEERSFLTKRVDQEARAAVFPLSRQLDSEESGQGSQPLGGFGGQRPGNGGSPGGGPGGDALNLPPGTYGERLEASGKIRAHLVIGYASSESPDPPIIPATLALEKLITVGSRGTSGLQYRVYAHRDPEDPGITVVAVPLHDVEETLSRLRLVEALVIGGALLVIGLTAYLVVRLGLRPLDRMRVTADEIATGQLSRRVSPANADTEIGRLGLSLNGMLDRLESAFAEREASEDRLRQFLADASHELRTPLSSIRGYAELFRMGATRGEAETANAMRRIEEESSRMGRLVEDLLTLARLDEAPERPRTPVDVAGLARAAVDDARATAPGRAIQVSAPERAIVLGDQHQLQQVLANLMRNALVHTPADTPIEVSVTTRGERVAISVRDHGAGLPAGAGEHLFERFWRAEGGRERGKGGAGLGLAIVRELIDAHDGTIRASNADGGGAQFEIELPLARDAAPA